MTKPRYSPLITINENNPNLINPIKRLALGSIIAGFLISLNIPPTNIQVLTIPWYLKLTALFITILGFAIALELNNLTLNLSINKTTKLSSFSTSLGYFPSIIHRIIPQKTLNSSHKLSLNLLDLIWLEKTIPKSTSITQTYLSKIIANQKGLVKLYFLSFLITISLIFILHILNPEWFQ